jgi:membrane dipeptidase
VATLIDGLQCGTFDRDAFQQLRLGAVGCVTVTCGFWERAVESMDSIGRWQDLVAANADLVVIARNADDIRAAIAADRTAIILGFQNAELFEGRIRFVERFAEMGVRQVQLTYNNQNELGGSCYEDADSGLTRFGREVIREMNRTGILVDLSHVGDRTTLDAIRHSTRPVAVSHANADAIVPHKRNKSTAVLHALRDTGGIIGCASYRNITGDHFCKTVDNWCGMVARMVDIAGIDHIGIGTDRSHNTSQVDLDWMRMGRWSREVNFGAGSSARPGKMPPPDWFTEVRQIGDIAGGLSRVGFSDAEVAKITHLNWLRVYDATLTPA